MHLRYQISDSYDESNRLISYRMVYDTVAQFYREQQIEPYTTTETYRYDALRRRIRYRSIKGAQCLYVEASSGCHSTVTRVIWDGNQILGEIRGDGSAGASASELEDDAPTYMGANYGEVAYVHGGVLDTPLEVIKNQDDTVLPVADYRGAIVTGTCPAQPCQTSQLVFPQSSEGVFGDKLYSSGWPSWYGTLIDGQTDASGYTYRRNRYLDPQTGRFTQEDPLGLAGGLNVYGYANGDPVNFSDPFGLCPDHNWRCEVAKAGWETLSGLGGSIAGFFGGAGVGLACGPAAEVCSPVLALGGAVAGAITGVTQAGKAVDHYYESRAENSSAGSSDDGVRPERQKLSSGEIKKLKKAGLDPEELKEFDGKADLFKDKSGDIFVHPKDGSGPGEPTGYNINNLPKSDQP